MVIKKSFAVTGLLVVLTITQLTSQLQVFALDLKELPSWFEIENPNMTIQEAKELIKHYKVTQESKTKYAEAFLRLDKFKEAGSLFLKTGDDNYRLLLEASKALSDESFLFAKESVMLLKATDTAKSLYCALLGLKPSKEIDSSTATKLLYRGYKTAKENLNHVELQEMDVHERNKKRLKIAKEALSDVKRRYEEELRRLGYDPEKF